MLAGITQAPRKPAYRSRLTILRTLQDALEMGSKTDLPQTLRVEAGYYFESLQNAQRALKLRRGWSKEKIIDAPLPDESVQGPAVLPRARDMTLRHW